MISGPTLVLGLPLGAAIVVYILRRWGLVASTVSAVVAAGLAWAVWSWPPGSTVILLWGTVEMGSTVSLLGQQLSLSAAAQPLITLYCALAAICFLYAGCMSQGRSFFSLGLVLLSVFNGAVLTIPFSRSIVWVVAAAAVAVYVIQAGRAGPTRGAVRWMVFPVMALPMFLLAAWNLDQTLLNPDDLGAFSAAAKWLAPGLVLLLAAVPVHGAIPALTAQAPPMVSAFLITASNGVALFLLNAFLRAYPWLADYYDVSRWLLWLGLVTAGWSGLMAAGQKRFGTLWGYAMLFDFGCVLAALGLGGPLGLTLAVTMFIARTLAVIIGAMGLATVRHRAEGDSFGHVEGAASRLPWSVAGLLTGGLSLVGLPLTVGFSGHWGLLQFLGQEMPRAAIVLLLGALAVMLGYVRGLRALLAPLQKRHMEREPALGAAAIGVMLFVCLSVSVSPQSLTQLVYRVTEALAAIAAVEL